MPELAAFAKDHPQRTYKKGEIILHAGQTPFSVFYIQKGFVKFYGLNDDGDEQLVGIDRPGDIFPIGWTLGKHDTAFYLHEALSPVTLSLLPRESFLKFLKEKPELSYELYTGLVDRYMALSSRINSMLQSGARYKLLFSLRYLATRYGKPYPLSPRKLVIDDFAITHQMIANMIGLSRETVSIEMKKLARDGFITQRIRRLVVDLEKINQLLSS